MQEKFLKSFLDKVVSGTVSRREFMRQASLLGVSAAAATSMLSVATVQAATPRKGGHLRFATSGGGTTDTLNPTKFIDTTDYLHNFQIQSPLVALDRKSQPIPALAESWEPNADGSEWVFKLRKGVTWTDGKDFTSADVIFSFGLHLGEKSESPAKPLLEQVKEMKPDGKHVVRMKLAGPNADLPVLFTQPHFMVTQEGEKTFEKPSGTGPYKLVEFKPGIRMDLVRNENYWGDAAHLDRFEIVTVLDSTARMNALLAGEFDIVEEVDRNLLGLVGNAPGVKIVNSPAGQHINLVMMCDREPTSNKDLRTALKLLIPRKRIVKNVFKGYGMIGNDHQVPPTDPFYCKDIPQREYDPDKAKFHLKKAGLEGGTVELHTSEQAGSGAEAISILYKEAAKAAGLDVKVTVVPAGSYWSAAWMKKPFVVSGWNPRPTADLMLTIANKSDGSWNETQWKSERFDQLLAAARGELDNKKRQEMYCEMQHMLHNDGGVGMLGYYDYIDAKRDNVGGFDPHPAGLGRNAFFGTELWLKS